jgi:hypothetical protein
MTASARLAPLHRWAALAIAKDDDPAVQQVGADFSKWLVGGGEAELADALGVAHIAMLRVTASLEARNAALIGMARRFSFKAAKVTDILRDYERSRWLRDAAAPSCPPDLLGTPLEYCWRALKARPHAPCERHVRDILKNGSHET